LRTAARATASLTPLPTPFILEVCSLETYASVQASAACAASGFGGAGVSMFIEIRELELHPVDYEENLAPGAIDLGPDLVQRAPLHAAGRVQLVEEHHGKSLVVQDIRVAGSLDTSLEMACARCLDPVVEKVERQYDLLYRPLGTDAGKEELSITAAEAEVSYYQGEGLLLEDVLREQVLLAAPLKVICREDCKGLCPHCGKNMNLEQCSCADAVTDPRWSALKDLSGKLKASGS
jgi:uncharacterized protein